MRMTLWIAAKMAIACCLFLAPVGYLAFPTILGKQVDIDFARKEILGLRYIADVRGVQDRVARGGAMAALVGRIAANQNARGADLKTAGPANALLKALKASDPAAASQAAADLIGKAAEASNLALDPDLDSYYTQDALTAKVPAAVAAVTALAAAVAATAGPKSSPADQVRIGVQVDALQPALDGLESDMDSAAQGNPDKTVDGAVTAPVAKVVKTATGVLARLADHANAASARTLSLPLLDALTAAGAADAWEVEHLLNARIAGLRWAELITGGVALSLFLTAVFFVLIFGRRDAVRPVPALPATVGRLPAYGLAAAVTATARGGEVVRVALAVPALKARMADRQWLDTEAAVPRAAEPRPQPAMERQTRNFDESTSAAPGSPGAAAAPRPAATGTADRVDRVARARDVSAGGASQNAPIRSAAANRSLVPDGGTIARQIAGAPEAVRKTVEQAEATGVPIRGVSEAIDHIGDILRLISDIAGRTTLLAPNTTIEAATTGEAGKKGLTVAMSQVKQSATQPEPAPERISPRIAADRDAAAGAAESAREGGEPIMAMDATPAAIAPAIGQQGEATREIAASVPAISRQNENSGAHSPVSRFGSAPRAPPGQAPPAAMASAAGIAAGGHNGPPPPAPSGVPEPSGVPDAVVAGTSASSGGRASAGSGAATTGKGSTFQSDLAALIAALRDGANASAAMATGAAALADNAAAGHAPRVRPHPPPHAGSGNAASGTPGIAQALANLLSEITAASSASSSAEAAAATASSGMTFGTDADAAIQSDVTALIGSLRNGASAPARASTSSAAAGPAGPFGPKPPPGGSANGPPGHSDTVPAAARPPNEIIATDAAPSDPDIASSSGTTSRSSSADAAPTVQANPAGLPTAARNGANPESAAPAAAAQSTADTTTPVTAASDDTDQPRPSQELVRGSIQAFDAYTSTKGTTLDATGVLA